MLSDLSQNTSNLKHSTDIDKINSIFVMIRNTDLDILQLPDENGETLLFKALSKGLECDGSIITELITKLSCNLDNFNCLNSSGEDVIEVIFSQDTKLSDYHRIKILQLLFKHIKFTEKHLRLTDDKGQTLSGYYLRFLS
jgi:hypothetical protein